MKYRAIAYKHDSYAEMRPVWQSRTTSSRKSAIKSAMQRFEIVKGSEEHDALAEEGECVYENITLYIESHRSRRFDDEASLW